jgi:hypothetical protein
MKLKNEQLELSIQNQSCRHRARQRHKSFSLTPMAGPAWSFSKVTHPAAEVREPFQFNGFPSLPPASGIQNPESRITEY